MIPLEAILILPSGGTAIKLLGVITFGSFAIHCIIGKERVQIDREIFIPLLLFVLWMILRGLESIGSAFTLLQLFLLFIITTSMCVNNKNRIDLLAWAIIIGSIISLLVSISMYLDNIELRYRAALGQDQDENQYAILMGFSFLLLLLKKSWLNSRRLSIVRYGMLSLFIYGLIIAASRGSIVALAFTILVYLFVSKNKLKSTFYVALCSLLIGTLVVIGIQKNLISEFSLERIQTLRAPKSMNARSGAWLVGIKMASDNLFVGVGLKKFNSNYKKYAGIHSLQALSVGAHNTYISIFAETGVVGLVLVLWIIGAFAYLLKKSKSETAILGLCLLSFMAVGSLGITTHFMKIFWICLALSYLYMKYPMQNKLEVE
jgi:O-antigen ligase